MAGYMAASFIGFLPSAAAAVVLSAAAVIIIFIGRSKKLMTAVVCLVFFSLGLASYSAYDEQLKLRSKEYSCADVGFTGIVKSIDSISGDRFAYTLKGRVNDGFSAGVLLYSGRLDAEIGDELTFFGRLKKLKGCGESRPPYTSCRQYANSLKGEFEPAQCRFVKTK